MKHVKTQFLTVAEKANKCKEFTSFIEFGLNVITDFYEKSKKDYLNNQDDLKFKHKESIVKLKVKKEMGDEANDKRIRQLQT